MGRWMGLLFFAMQCFAAPREAWINSLNVPGLYDALIHASALSSLPPRFPIKVPSPGRVPCYFSHFEASPHYYFLSLDASADCSAHVCQLLTLMARALPQGEKPPTFPILTNREGEVMTQKVPLGKGEAYYTRGFSAGDYFDPQLSWHQEGVAYTLSWADGYKEEAKTEAALLKMAKSLALLKDHSGS